MDNKITISKIYGHLHTITKHRWEVFKAMAMCGKVWQGLTHDLSKFSPTELLEGFKYYQGTGSPINVCKADLGYSRAWFHHRGRNKHHSQYWCDISFGEVIPAEMPWKYLLELICDGIAAGKTYQKNGWSDNSPLEYFKAIDCKSYYHKATYNKLLIYYKLIAKYSWETVAKYIKEYGDISEHPSILCQIDHEFNIFYLGDKMGAYWFSEIIIGKNPHDIFINMRDKFYIEDDEE